MYIEEVDTSVKALIAIQSIEHDLEADSLATNKENSSRSALLNSEDL